MTKNKTYRRKKNILRKRGIIMLPVDTISQRYGFHANTVRAWVNRDRIRHVRHGSGGKIFIRQDDVEKFIKIWYEEGGEQV